jgi:hypothetical protein
MWWRPFGRPVSGREAFQPGVWGSRAADAESSNALGDVADSGAKVATGDFDRMVVLLRSNERLFGTLEGVSQRLHEVRAYLAQDDCNHSLARECYRYWQTRHSGVLTQLRANRLEARHVLGRLDAAALERSPLAGGSQVTT